jgi:hypothetical protein
VGHSATDTTPLFSGYLQGVANWHFSIRNWQFVGNLDFSSMNLDGDWTAEINATKVNVADDTVV